MNRDRGHGLMIKPPPLSQEQLKKLLEYDAATGKLYWCSGRNAGREAGTITRGYVRVNICGKRVLAHRLVWLYLYNEWPGELDHVNGDCIDNREENLQEVTHAENMEKAWERRVELAREILDNAR